MLKFILFFLSIIILIRFLFRKFSDLPAARPPRFSDYISISNLMSERDFWDIIGHTRQLAKRNYRMQCEILTEYLHSLPATEIVKFNRTFQLLMAESYTFRLWEPVYALNGGCSDDCFEYFRSWLIAQGEKNFYSVIQHPRRMFLICAKELLQHYEGFAYCSYEAYMSKTGLTIPQSTDIPYREPGPRFDENKAFLRYPELALLAW